jgi:hypothetical protein
MTLSCPAKAGHQVITGGEIQPIGRGVLDCPPLCAIAHQAGNDTENAERACHKLAITSAKRKKAGIAPGLSYLEMLRVAYFASARFGGVAGHDLISVS